MIQSLIVGTDEVERAVLYWLENEKGLKVKTTGKGENRRMIFSISAGDHEHAPTRCAEDEYFIEYQVEV